MQTEHPQAEEERDEGAARSGSVGVLTLVELINCKIPDAVDSQERCISKRLKCDKLTY